MIPAQDSLSALERDALTELANIGVSRAAASLRKMVGQQVLLSVPSVDVVNRRTAAILLGERESDDLVAVRQAFTGAFSGRALLIFPQANSLELVRSVLGPDMSEQDVADMEQEALAEIGNIILNGCLATMANILHSSLSMSLPEVLSGTGPQLFELDAAAPTGGLVLFFFINFSVHDRDIRGYIAMLMDLTSLAALRSLIGAFIQSVMSDDVSHGDVRTV